MSKNDKIIEALLFASPEPLTQKKLAHIFDRDIPDLKLSVERLNSFYNKNNQSIEIINVAGGYQLRTKQEFSIFIKKLFNNNFQNSISQAALESLSIVAYKQPVSKSLLESIRGVDCSGVIKTLLKKYCYVSFQFCYVSFFFWCEIENFAIHIVDVQGWGGGY